MPAASVLERAVANGAPHGNGVMEAPMFGDPQLHDALLGDPAKLTEPIKRVEDKFQLLPAFLKVQQPHANSLSKASSSRGPDDATR